jgi:hypothetical protein
MDYINYKLDNTNIRTVRDIVNTEINNEKSLVDKFIVISSSDRNWQDSERQSNESPYNFTVNFGQNSTYTRNGKIYKNNIFVNNILRNVKNLRCTNVIFSNKTHSNGLKLHKIPLILFNVKNIKNNNNVLGSNQNLDNMVCPLNLKNMTLFSTSASIKVENLEYINTNQQQLNFSAPENINKMDIEFLNMDGTSMIQDNSLNDILEIKQMYYNPSTSNLLQITTNTFFTSDEFEKGDKLLFSNYEFRETSLGYKECELFNAFINRNEGHIIQQIDKSNTLNELYDIIRIFVPCKFSQSSTTVDVETWFNDLVTKTNIDDFSNDDNTGRLLNYNSQTQIFINIKHLL